MYHYQKSQVPFANFFATSGPVITDIIKRHSGVKQLKNIKLLYILVKIHLHSTLQGVQVKIQLPHLVLAYFVLSFAHE